MDHRRHADRTGRGRHQIVPQIDEQRTVHVSQDVGRCGPPAARPRTRARGRPASQGRIHVRAPTSSGCSGKPHPRERVRHAQAGQVIRHPHPPAPRGGLPGEYHLRLRCQLTPRPPQAAGRRLPPWATSGHSHTPTAWYVMCPPAGQARPGSSRHWPGRAQAVRQVPSLILNVSDQILSYRKRFGARLCSAPELTRT